MLKYSTLRFPEVENSQFRIRIAVVGDSLAQEVLVGKAGAVDNFLNFLKAGGSVYPLEALQIAGVDMTSPESVETTFGVLAGYVDRLEALVGQRG